MITGSDQWSTGFIDSGTTFTYVPPAMWDALMYHFDYFCDQTKDILNEYGYRKYCNGKRFTTRIQGDIYACFEFDPDQFRGREKEFLLGYPIIVFHALDHEDKAEQIKWFPSEYLFK